MARLAPPLVATVLLSLGLVVPAVLVSQRTGSAAQSAAAPAASPPAAAARGAPPAPPRRPGTTPAQSLPTTPTPAGGFGAPVLAPAGIPAVGRDPCVQLAACYRDLSRSLCTRRGPTCRRAFAAPAAGLPSEDCRARLADAGLTAAPWARGSFGVPDACVD